MPSAKGWRRRRDQRTDQEIPIGAIIDGLMREPLFARGAPIGTLLGAWSDVVGPRLAAESSPLSLDNELLVIAVTSGPWGSQVRFMVDEIRRKTEELLGSGSVKRVQVIVRPDAVPRSAPPSPEGPATQV